MLALKLNHVSQRGPWNDFRVEKYIKISMKCIPKSPIDNNRFINVSSGNDWAGNKSMHESMMTQFCYAYTYITSP